MIDDVGFPTDHAPSVDECSAEIVRTLRGVRDAELRHLGTIDEHVRVLVANSADPILTRLNFEYAIERRVQLWQPNPVSEPLPTLHMLDLLRAWTPAGGFEKTFYLITRWNGAVLECSLPFARDRIADLRMRALRVLERYFSVTPHKENASWAAYLDYLNQLLRDPRYRLYAARRLHYLAIINLGDNSIIPLLDDQPDSIVALLELAIEHDKDSLKPESITALYAKCKSRGRLMEFDRAVATLGGETDVLDGRVTVLRFRDKTYELNQTKNQIAKTWQTVPAALSQTVNRVVRAESAAQDVEMGISTKTE
jgi:hypothetical protein